MESTSPSLLSRVRDLGNKDAWREFESRYRDLLVNFCISRGLQRADAEDVVQGVFAGLARSLPQFVYDPQRGRFRDYLYRCARNSLSQWFARPSRTETRHSADFDVATQAAARPDTAMESAWEQEWIAHHVRMAQVRIAKTFESRSIELFNRNLAGESVANLASTFAMSEQAVRKVRQRIRDRMEEYISEQIREEDDIPEAA